MSKHFFLPDECLDKFKSYLQNKLSDFPKFSIMHLLPMKKRNLKKITALLKYGLNYGNNSKFAVLYLMYKIL